MWQRKQTIYLITVVVLLLAMQALPVAWLEPISMGMGKQVYPTLIYDMTMHSVTYGMVTLLAVISVFGIVDAIAAIFLFKNRKMQMKLCRLGQVMMVLWYVILAITLYMEKGDCSIKVQFAAILPLVSLIVYQLAYKGVKHDDDLVRSADRIR